MASVENRVVSMEFNNSNFESKVAATIGSLRDLSSSLSFPNAKGGFDDITSAANKVNMGGLSDSIEGVSAKFLALSTVAITALANITSKAVDAGLTFAKSSYSRAHHGWLQRV